MNVRAMDPGDVCEILRLMRRLAEIERYIDDFQVTEAVLRRRAFVADPDFTVFACTAGTGAVVGYAVTYWVRWTYTLKPTLILKELFIEKAARGLGCGQVLFEHVAAQAQAGGAGRVEWLVLPDNASAARFYARQGAERDEDWHRWSLSLPVSAPVSTT